MELDLFMYSIMAIAFAFFLYTVFLLFGFKPEEKKKTIEEEEDTK